MTRRAYTRRPGIQQVCKGCGKPFLAHATVQVACSEECKFLMYQQRGADDECWEWSGPRNHHGYGVLFLNTNNENGRRNVASAHRFSYLREHGAMPEGKPCVLHRCDNPACTNPKHLFAGDWAINNADRAAKGRTVLPGFDDAKRARYSAMNRGAKNNSAKLTEEQARAIKFGHSDLSSAKVAALYGVSKSTAKYIRSGKLWAHI